MPFDHVLITGASSGLGAALARALARPGTRLHLGARRPAELAEVAEACRTLGAEVETRCVDVRDGAAMEAWITGVGRLDLVIANAGISAGTGHAAEAAATAREIFETNILGAMNTTLPALQVMGEQTPGPDGWRGHVAVVASLAAFVAGPSAPAYSASKATVQRWTEARDATERRRGIRLHAVCPGFVQTAMTERNAFPMPWLMTADQAAARTLRGIERGRLRVVYPRRLYLIARLVGALPPGLRNRLMALVPPKAI